MLYITRYIRLLAMLLLMGSLFSCSDKDDVSDIDLPGLGGETWEPGPLDKWLTDNYVNPYNIQVKYRFDRYELALNKDLVPVEEARVIPVMSAISKTWIAPYSAEAGENFIKKYSPKLFVLVGSPQYNTNGTITLGTAEGGRMIVLYVLNYFSNDNKEIVQETLHTIHHEFAHILHQTIMYPVEFKKISTGYTASWNDYGMEEALELGFISQYARSAPDEDFVEMISLMLVNGPEWFNRLVQSAPPDAQEKLRKKEEIVVSYMKQSWNIDFYSLQRRTQDAINNL